VKLTARSTALDGGSATIEFVAVGILLLVPLVYVVISLSRIQAATFAADSSAREVARAFVTAAEEDDGRRRASIAVQLGLRDQGFGNPADGDLAIECETSTACLTPGSQIRVLVTVRVILPGVPRFLGRALSTDVTVRARQAAVVDQFRAQGGDP
jgi:Na+-transporting methylmalonyl-CoA/oxaloacetate decarboxylase gamma subunit